MGAVVVNLRHLCKAHPAMYNRCSSPVRFCSKGVSDLLTRAITLDSPSTFYVSMASPASLPTDMYTSMGAYGSAVDKVRRCSMLLKILFSASVHRSSQTPGPFGERSSSIGPANSLKFGTNGEAHSSLPSVC